MPRHYRHPPWQDMHPHDDLPPIHHVGVGHGVRWISEGWALFLRRPGFWLLAALLQTLLVMLVLLVPLLGQVGAHLLMPILSAGLMVVAQRIYYDEPVTVPEAFTGFREHAPAVVNVGVWYMLGWMLIVALGLLLGGGAALSGMAVGLETQYEWLGTIISVFGILLAIVISLLLVLPLVMSVWLAPPLAVFHDIPAMQAMKHSFVASWRSLPAFVVAFFLVALMLFLTSLTLGLALLVVIPVMAGATYAAYRDLFELPQHTPPANSATDDTGSVDA
ncbi:MAG: hypothetical protein FGM53_02005 [Rhodocyclaceae bacterium]|nr:hypothetical protein [Rhodocyclaceae bacterium]